MQQMFCVYLTLIFCIYHTSAITYNNIYVDIQQEFTELDPGEPLILTPLIKDGKIKEAQTAAEVKFNGLKGIKSYAGYLTVNEAFNSNLFFWFFPAETNNASAPVMVWLQGGPGATSLIGLFIENGPFSVKTKHGLKLRKYSWTQSHSVIYIDNPAGAGYSFTKNGGYVQNQTVIGDELYCAILQVFQLFPEFQKNDFFVTGESYGGKYVPALTYAIHKNNPSANLKINLQGFAIGNGLSDPENQLKYSDYLYQIGLIDTNVQTKIQEIEEQAINYIHNKQWAQATGVFDELFDNNNKNKTCLFQNITGFTNFFNYLVSNDTGEKFELLNHYVQREDIRAAIHVGNTSFNQESQEVRKNLAEDIMQSVAPWVSELLGHYRGLIYSGQLDIIVAYPLTVNYLKNLKFSGADQYKTAERHKWYANSELAGFVKQAGNLTEVLVRNAGHMVPADQPLWALDMITRFTRNKPFY